MANISREERMRRESERSEERKQRLDQATTGDAQTGSALLEADIEDQREQRAARDERRPEWRPATLAGYDDKGNAFVIDERLPPGDVGKATNQMTGRAAIAQEMRPDAYLHNEDGRTVQNPHGPLQGQGTEVRLLNGYQPETGPKRLKGELVSLPDREARRLVNLGKAKFTDLE
jgi:hypothetical protein